MTARKNFLMYKLFGFCKETGKHCKDCEHLMKHVANRTYYKCECYGDTSSEDSRTIQSRTEILLRNLEMQREGEQRMSELKSWYDFCYEKESTPEGSELTQIACPVCGRALYKDLSSLMYHKYKYFCIACSWTGYA